MATKNAAEKSAGQGGLTPEDIEAWYHENFNNSVVSRDVEVFNHVRKAVNELKRRAKPQEN